MQISSLAISKISALFFLSNAKLTLFIYDLFLCYFKVVLNNFFLIVNFDGVNTSYNIIYVFF